MIGFFKKNFLSEQFLKYAAVGFLGTFLDFGLLYLLVQYLHLFYLLAAVLSVFVVLWVSFTLNKYWTFGNFEKKYFRQFLQYAISHSIALGANLAVLSTLVEIFHFWYLFAKIFATIAAAIVNFLLVKKFIFLNKSDTIIERSKA